MDVMITFIFIIMLLIAIFLGIQSIKYFIVMWKFKNRKKDGSEDKDFKYFD